ncbi:low-affinity Zn(2+) transporter [Martiniozyma asiatica (nom. inval.)]|nr:low-affinity Zn(2+) transporter [Martiniozyma asiatica]
MEISVRDICEAGNDYDGSHLPVRISSIFVIGFASGLGAFFPVLSSRYSWKLSQWCFFTAKYFGSGVIVATAFIHLLQPANESLSNDCLGNPFDVYPIAFGICLIVLMLMFFLELIAYRWIEAKIGGTSTDVSHSHSHFGNTDMYVSGHSHNFNTDFVESEDDCELQELTDNHSPIKNKMDLENSDISISMASSDPSGMKYAGQLLNVFVLEFGIIFHSIFIGLTLACAGEEFISLYIVLVFHQLFEGLGLGTRIAAVPWPLQGRKRLTPWFLCSAFTITTPIAIAIGLGVRNSYPPGSRRALIVNGVFDSISAGILVYTGLIELMAREFLFSDEFKGEGGFKKMVYAYLIMCTGAGIMALLGRWA